ncbi:MAG TPA: hypothetical protein VGW78_03410 [Candidatus Babeliales bacterium]|nr:hypothetical protein [Candidatus Babeliales bacterium]
MKRIMLFLFCVMQLSVPFCLAMKSKQKPELPETTFGIIKREYASLGCEFVKAGAAGSLATMTGSALIIPIR